jgi:hypothetical protein
MVEVGWASIAEIDFCRPALRVMTTIAAFLAGDALDIDRSILRTDET